MSTIKPTTVPTKRLAETIASTDYTFKLNNIAGWDGNDLVAANFGSIGYAVLRNASNTLMEIIAFDPTTIASSSITILYRGLNFTGDLTTEIAGNKMTWVKNQTIVELGAPTPQLLEWLKEYIDAAAIAGGIPATTTSLGIAKLSYAPISAPSPIAVGDNDPRIPQNAYGVDSGISDTYAITLTNAPLAYSTGQQFSFKANTGNTGTATLNVNALGAKTIVQSDGSPLTDNQILPGQIVRVIYDGTNFRISNTFFSTKFGGAGTDGALNVTSGTTTINLANAAVVIKNYTSMNVSSGATLTFSNPNVNGTVIILKSQGAVTIAGTVNASGMGATGGASVSIVSGNESGNAGNNGLSYSAVISAPVGSSAPSNSTSAVATSVPILAMNNGYYSTIPNTSFMKYSYIVTSAAGASGAARVNSITGTGNTGSGGAGGGTLLIECGGSLNYTGAINVSGVNGGNATVSGGQQASAGGGGGGGGMLVLLYNTLIANSGTTTSAGGTGGTSTITTNVSGAGAGAGGASFANPGGAGSNVTSGIGGGTGGAGVSFIIQNNDFS